MRPRPTIVPLTLAHAFAATCVLAQPNLPPPPPPPMGQSSDVPPPPAPQASSFPASSSRPSAPPTTPQPRRGLSSPAPPSTQPPYRTPRHRRPEVVIVDDPRSRPIALTLAPLPLALGRLSASAEILLASHHSLVGSPNVLFAQIDRGGRYNLFSEGFGFASPTSGGFGVELGYHYWWQSLDSLRGPYLGPSLLVGATTQANAGDASHAQGYWGFAFDLGAQEVLSGGFTLGGGVGLGIVKMADATALFPRLLLQVGWSP